MALFDREKVTAHTIVTATQASEKLPAVFEDIRRTFAFRVCGDKQQMFEQYRKHMGDYQGILETFQELFVAAGEASGFADMPEFQHDLQDGLSADLWAKGPETIKATLDSSLDDDLRSLLGAVVRMLDSLVEKRRAGTIEWSCSESCVLTFYQGQTKQRATGVRHYANRTETDVETSLLTSVYRHDLIKVKPHALPAEQIPKPQRVQDFLRAIRKWLLPFLRIIDGTIVRKQTGTTTTVLRTEVRTVLKPDPVIAIGDHVLVGWCPEEVEKDAEEERVRRAQEREEWLRWKKRKEEEKFKNSVTNVGSAGIVLSMIIGVLSVILLGVSDHLHCDTFTGAMFITCGVMIVVFLVSSVIFYFGEEAL
jgi:hypothetical protein